MPGGCDRTLRVLIAVHRGCTSEHCGFRQRHVAAQELESTTQEKTSRLLNTLEARLCGRDTVADRSSKEFCEALPSGH
jgi:hypothetical protein